MSNQVAVKIETIDDYKEEIKNKKEEIMEIIDVMINETEKIEPFFDTSAGRIINESFLEYLKNKKEDINNKNLVFINNLNEIIKLYDETDKVVDKAVTQNE